MLFRGSANVQFRLGVRVYAELRTIMMVMITAIITRIYPLVCCDCGSSLVSERGVWFSKGRVLYRQRCGNCGALQEGSLDSAEVVGDKCLLCADSTLTFVDGTLDGDGWRIKYTCSNCGPVVFKCSMKKCGDCRWTCLRKGPARESTSEMSFEMGEMCLD